MSTDDYNNNIFEDDVYPDEDRYESEEDEQEYVPQKKSNKPVDKVKDFFLNLWDRIQSFGVKRAAIIGGLVLLLVIIIIICSAVSSSKNKTPKTDKKNNIAVEDITNEETSDKAVVTNPATVSEGSIGGYTVVLENAESVNMRSRADANSERITTIPNGTYLNVLFIDDRDKDVNDGYGWGYVEYENERGWVFMEYLKPGKQQVENANGSVG